MAASSATPVPYFSALFIKVLETTYKSYQLSASRLVKYVPLFVRGFTISEWDERGSVWGKTAATGAGSAQIYRLVVCKDYHTQNTHHTHPNCRQLNFKTKLELLGCFISPLSLSN